MNESLRHRSASAASPTIGEEPHDELLAHLHDTVLQEVEQIAVRAAGCLCAHCAPLAAAAHRASHDLREVLAAGGVPEQGESLTVGLRAVVADAVHSGGQHIELVLGPTDDSLTADGIAALIGAAREALNNARRHSRARHVVVYCEEARGSALVSVRDEGVREAATEIREGFGLRRSIIGRMRSCGGWAQIERVGASVIVTLGVGARGFIA